MSRSLPPCICVNTALIAKPEASVVNMNSLEKSGRARMGAVIMHLLRSLKANSCSFPQCHSTSFLNRSYKGFARVAKFETK